MDFAAHGYCGYFLLSLMDAHWKVGLGETEALALARLCIKELATRFTIHQPNFSVKIVDAKGIRVLQL
jgi:20S proteasome subunit beta 4